MTLSIATSPRGSAQLGFIRDHQEAGPGSKAWESGEWTRRQSVNLRSISALHSDQVAEASAQINRKRSHHGKVKPRLKVGLPPVDHIESGDPRVWWAGGCLYSVVAVKHESGPNMGWFHRSIERKNLREPLVNARKHEAIDSEEPEPDAFGSSATSNPITPIERRRVHKLGPAPPPPPDMLNEFLDLQFAEKKSCIPLERMSTRISLDLPTSRMSKNFRVDHIGTDSGQHGIYASENDSLPSGSPINSPTESREMDEAESTVHSRVPSRLFAETNVPAPSANSSIAPSMRPSFADRPSVVINTETEKIEIEAYDSTRVGTTGSFDSFGEDSPPMSPGSLRKKAGTAESPKRARLKRMSTRCNLKRKAERLLDDQSRRFSMLDDFQRGIVETAFKRWNLNNSGLLSLPELRACVLELGFSGTTSAEREEIMRVCTDAVKNADSLEKGWENCRAQNSSKQAGDHEPATVSIYELTLGILPRLRLASEEVFIEELHKKLSNYGADIAKRVPVNILSRLLWQEGIDPIFFNQTLTSMFNGRGLEKGAASVELAAKAGARCREDMLCAVRRRERAVQYEAHINEEVFTILQSSLLDFYDRFLFYASIDSSSGVSYEIAKFLSAEFGLIPKGKDARQEFEDELKKVCLRHFDRLTFRQFIEHVRHRRDMRLRCFSEQLNKFFDQYDKDKNGELNMAEISSMLESLGLTPKTREEQDNIKELFLELDRCGTGKIDRNGFHLIYLRMDEQLKRLSYASKKTTALKHGIPEEDIHDIINAFDGVDPDGQGTITLTNAKSAFGLVRRSHYHEDEAFHHIENPAAVEFTEFLIAVAPDGRLTRSGGKKDTAYSLPSSMGGQTPRSLHFESSSIPFDLTVCRQALRKMKLPKTFVQSLEDSELIAVLAGYLGCEDLSEESFAQHLLIKLHVSTEKELLNIATDFGRHLEQEAFQIEPADSGGQLSRDRPFPPKFLPSHSGRTTCHSNE